MKTSSSWLNLEQRPGSLQYFPGLEAEVTDDTGDARHCGVDGGSGGGSSSAARVSYVFIEAQRGGEEMQCAEVHVVDGGA